MRETCEKDERNVGETRENCERNETKWPTNTLLRLPLRLWGDVVIESMDGVHAFQHLLHVRGERGIRGPHVGESRVAFATAGALMLVEDCVSRRLAHAGDLGVPAIVPPLAVEVQDERGVVERIPRAVRVGVAAMADGVDDDVPELAGEGDLSCRAELLIWDADDGVFVEGVEEGLDMRGGQGGAEVEALEPGADAAGADLDHTHACGRRGRHTRHAGRLLVV